MVAENVARSKAMLEVFEKAGISKADLAANLEDAAKSTTNVIGRSANEYGAKLIKQSFILGKQGTIKIVSVWTDTGNSLKLVTLWPKP